MEWEREDIYDKVIQGGLIGLIIVTPLPKGSVGVQYFSFLELMIFCLLALWCVKVISGGDKTNRIRERGKVYWRKTPLFIPLIFLILFVAFQLIPFPPKTLKAFSPNTSRLYETLLPLYGYGKIGNTETDQALFTGEDRAQKALPFLEAPGKWRSLSLYAHNTREYFLKILAYAATFFLVLQTIRTRAQAKRLVYAIIFTGFAVAALSIIHKYSYNGKALWLWKPLASHAHPYGPFVNRNHFAGYVNLIIPLGLGIAMYEAERISRGVKGYLRKLRWFLVEEKGPRVFIFSLASVITAVALFLSLSRGGVLSFVAALFFMSLMVGSRRSIRKRALTILLISCLLGLITWFGWDPIIQRMETFKYLAKNPIAEWRIQVWPDTIGMFKDYPILGTGVGTYMTTFPMYESVKRDLLATHAENDYLQMLTEGGIVGTAISALLLVMFLFTTVARWKERHDRFVVYIVLGSLVGIIGFLLATIVNFNFHLPANAFLFTVVVGVSFALVNTRSKGNRDCVKLNVKLVPIGKTTRYILCPALITVLSVFTIQVAKIWAAEVYFIKATKVIESEAPSDDHDSLFSNKATGLNPINSKYRVVKARQELRRAERTSALNMKKLWTQRAIDELRKAVNLEPTNGYYWMYLGWTTGFNTGEYELARKSYENSVKVHPANDALHEQYALWAFTMARADRKFFTTGEQGTFSRLFTEEFIIAPDSKEFLDIGVREYKAAASLNPSLIEEALWRYSEFTLDPKKLRGIVPFEQNYNPLIKEIISKIIITKKQ